MSGNPLQRGFLNPVSLLGAHRCLPKLGLVCPQKLLDDQYSSSGLVLWSVLVGRDDGEVGDFSPPLPLGMGSFLC